MLHIIQSTECQLQYLDMMNDWTVLFTHILVYVGSSQYQLYFVIYFNFFFFFWYHIMAWTLFLSYFKYICLWKKTNSACVNIWKSLIFLRYSLHLGWFTFDKVKKKLVKQWPSSFYIVNVYSNVFTIIIKHSMY